MKNNIEELTLLLMYLTSWEEKGYTYDEKGNIEETKIKNCWKGYEFEILNSLTDKGYLIPANYKNKSVALTKSGEEMSKKLIEKYLK